MFKSLRWTERFFRLGLWLVALSFASFLNTLGTRLIEELNLPAPSETDFMDPVRLKEFYAQHDQAVAEQFKIEEKLSKARHEHVAAKANTEAASDTFRNWVSTREATARPDQDRELIARTRALDALRGVERNALARVQDIQVDFEEVQRKRSLVSDKFTALQKLAAEPYDAALAKIQRREFVARISVLLAVMALAIWLWTKQRKSRWWPFVWGYLVCRVCLLRPGAALLASLRRVRALYPRHLHNLADWMAGHRIAAALPRTTGGFRRTAGW
jgi:hypothetical protein